MFTYLRLAVLFVLLLGSTLAVSPLLAPAGDAEAQTVAADEIDPAQLVAVVETEKFRLHYPVAFMEEIPLKDILTRLIEAFDRVENEFGAFEDAVDVYVPGVIVHEGAAAHNLRIAGLTWEEEDRVVVLVALWAAHDVDTFAHELLHARLRDADIHPPHWFEEGLAHFMESEDGFHEELYEILLENGPVTLDEAAEIEGITADEMRLRATAWLLTYYLHNYEGMTLGEIAGEVNLPDPVEVLEVVKKEVECKSFAASEDLFTHN